MGNGPDREAPAGLLHGLLMHRSKRQPIFRLAIYFSSILDAPGGRFSRSAHRYRHVMAGDKLWSTHQTVDRSSSSLRLSQSGMKRRKSWKKRGEWFGTAA
jgi:hypothetical protein